MTIPELTRRGYPESKILGTLSGRTLGLLIPPSIIMIYRRRRMLHRLFIAGIVPGTARCCSWAASPGGRSAIRAKCRRPIRASEKLSRSRHLIPVMLLIGAVLGSITRSPPPPRRRPWAGALILSALLAR